MEQLILFLLIGIGSLISGYLQNKKKREAEQREIEMEAAAPRRTAEATTMPPLVSKTAPETRGPQSAPDWREELRRLLQGQMPEAEVPPRRVPVPPVNVPPVVAPLKEIPRRIEKRVPERALVRPRSIVVRNTYERASRLREQVEQSFEGIDSGVKSHPLMRPPQTRRGTAASVAKRWTRNRQSLREAFIASLIFAPPVGLRPAPENGVPE